MINHEQSDIAISDLDDWGKNAIINNRSVAILGKVLYGCSHSLYIRFTLKKEEPLRILKSFMR